MRKRRGNQVATFLETTQDDPVLVAVGFPGGEVVEILAFASISRWGIIYKALI